jgi:hypothetical protein
VGDAGLGHLYEPSPILLGTADLKASFAEFLGNGIHEGGGGTVDAPSPIAVTETDVAITVENTSNEMTVKVELWQKRVLHDEALSRDTTVTCKCLAQDLAPDPESGFEATDHSFVGLNPDRMLGLEGCLELFQVAGISGVEIDDNQASMLSPLCPQNQESARSRRTFGWHRNGNRTAHGPDVHTLCF